MMRRCEVSSVRQRTRRRTNSPIFSVPTVRTSKKQNGKSSTDRARYTPTAVQPYSLDSFFSLALSECGSAAAGFPFGGVAPPRRRPVEWRGRLARTEGDFHRPNPDRATADLGPRSCAIPALWCHGMAGILADIRLVESFLALFRATPPRIALLPRRASSAPNAVRNMAAGVVLGWLDRALKSQGERRS